MRFCERLLRLSVPTAPPAGGFVAAVLTAVFSAPNADA